MENHMKPTLYAPFLSLVLAACNNLYSPATTQPPPPSFTAIRARGDSGTVADTLNKFRAALGGSLNAPNTAPADSGRREINWDGVPVALTNIDTFPATFFNVNSKRGAVFSTPGTGLRVDSTAFASVNAGLAELFKGFGVVFSDVDKAAATRVEYFDANGVELASIASPAQLGAQGFTFVGAVFESAIVARVLITSGDAALSATITDVSAGGTDDVVAMDDFVYGEPQPLPHTSNYAARRQ